jgi:predicted nuclease of predicted toxin-antitoxin system
MRFLIDECLHPELAGHAHRKGFQATCIRDLGMCGRKDWEIAAYVTRHDYVLVTHNAKDFRDHNGMPGHLTQRQSHPGLICLNSTSRPMTPILQNSLFGIALAYLSDERIDHLINQVLEISLLDEEDVEIRLYEAPKA